MVNRVKRKFTDEGKVGDTGLSAGFWKGGYREGSSRRLWIIVPKGGSRISGYRVYIEQFSASKARRENYGSCYISSAIKWL